MIDKKTQMTKIPRIGFQKNKILILKDATFYRLYQLIMVLYLTIVFKYVSSSLNKINNPPFIRLEDVELHFAD